MFNKAVWWIALYVRLYVSPSTLFLPQQCRNVYLIVCGSTGNLSVVYARLEA